MKNKHTFDVVHDTQAVFRTLLDCTANPGRPGRLERAAEKLGEDGLTLALSMTLLDTQTTFYIDESSDSLREQIEFLTGSRRVPLAEADFIFLPQEVDARQVLDTVKQGTYADPHCSATLFIASKGYPDCQAAIEGPGVPPGGTSVLLTKPELEWLMARDEMQAEYPCGIELVFVREEGDVAAFPRKIRRVK